MTHEARGFKILPVDSVEELAEKLACRSWTLCTGFQNGDYLFLNDAFHEDAPQEYAVLKMPQVEDGPHLQIGIIPFPQLGYEKSLCRIRQILFGKFQRATVPLWNLYLEPISEHDPCQHCA